MVKVRTILIWSVISASVVLRSDETHQYPAHQYTAPHPECTFWGANHEKFVKTGKSASLSALTERVVAGLPRLASSGSSSHASSDNTIDTYIFPAIAASGVTPAPPTTDYEFMRRVTLYLTWRIPTPHAVTSFVA